VRNCRPEKFLRAGMMIKKMMETIIDNQMIMNYMSMYMFDEQMR
jgi:hypothetical protein